MNTFSLIVVFSYLALGCVVGLVALFIERKWCPLGHWLELTCWGLIVAYVAVMLWPALIYNYVIELCCLRASAEPHKSCDVSSPLD